MKKEFFLSPNPGKIDPF